MSRVTLEDALIEATVGGEKPLFGIDIFHTTRMVNHQDLYLDFMRSAHDAGSHERATAIGNRLAELLGPLIYPNDRFKTKPKFHSTHTEQGRLCITFAIPHHLPYNWMEKVFVDEVDFCHRFRIAVS